MAAPLILEHLTKRFGNKTAVDDISLELVEGEVFGFLGPNGAGKSTTIRLAMDFLKPTRGNVKLFGADDVSGRTQKHGSVGYLAGDIALYEAMSGRTFLKFMACTGLKADWKYVDELTERFQATLDKPIKTLSKGNRQKIGLIGAFMHQPKLLILDEPTSGLDPLMKQVFYELVSEAAKRGATVFVSSHDLAEVQKICDRAGFIRAGKLISVDTIASLKDLAVQRYFVSFAKKFDLAAARKLASVKSIESRGDEFEFTVSGEITEFIQFISKFAPRTLRESELELEELFMKFYSEEA